MPYIKAEERSLYDEDIAKLANLINTLKNYEDNDEVVSKRTNRSLNLFDAIYEFFYCMKCKHGDSSMYGVTYDLAQKMPTDIEKTCGHMNYVISKLIKEVYDNKFRYCDINEIIGVLENVRDEYNTSIKCQNTYEQFVLMGVLECIKMEFYRKVASPYEDQKELENGKVY